MMQSQGRANALDYIALFLSLRLISCSSRYAATSLRHFHGYTSGQKAKSPETGWSQGFRFCDLERTVGIEPSVAGCIIPQSLAIPGL
jgi:hypothetical protein